MVYYLLLIIGTEKSSCEIKQSKNYKGEDLNYWKFDRTDRSACISDTSPWLLDFLLPWFPQLTLAGALMIRIQT